MSEGPPSRASVLVVDDEPGPRESLRLILAPRYRVLQARSGSEALETLRREPVAVVTLDLHMPGMPGQELMRSVRAEFPDVEIIVITGCGSLESAAEGIRCGISDYLQKPFDVVQVSAAVARAVSRQRARERGAPTAGPERTTIDFLEVLAETIEAKDRFMRGHARRVAVLTSLVARRMGLGREEQEQARLAAFLHDLGKVGVPTDLLLRAGALDAAEQRLVQRHPEIGARLLYPLRVPRPVTLAIRHHHEWWNGSGYPDGLAGEEIPLAARIVAVADAFDAMSCDRPYRRSLDRERVADELRRFSGIQFDPDVAPELLGVLESSPDADADARLLAEALAWKAPPARAAAPAG